MARNRDPFSKRRSRNSRREGGLRGYKVDKPVPVEVPPEGCRQVRGTWPTDDETVPPIPQDLPLWQHPHWASMWSSTPKQYVSPDSDDLLPWDTYHNVLGARNGFPGTEIYVPGCFGYDEDGTEWSGRPDIPGYSCRPVFDARETGIVDPNYDPKEWEYSEFEKAMTNHNEFKPEPINKPLTLPVGRGRINYMNEETDPNWDGAEPLGHTLGGTDSWLPQNSRLPGHYSLGPQTTVWPELELDFSTMPWIELELALKVEQSPLSAKIGQKIGFADLPGEIRNQIYGYVVDGITSIEIEITWCTKGRDLTHYRHRKSIADKMTDLSWRSYSTEDDRFEAMFTKAIEDNKATTRRRELAREGTTLRASGRQSSEYGAGGLAALLRVCRLTYTELCSTLYGGNTFSFASRSLLLKFMKNLTPFAKGFISNIYLAHDMQGAPENPKLAFLKFKDRERWVQTLQKVATECTSLRELYITLKIRDAYITLDALENEWGQDLVKGLKGLKSLPLFENFELCIHLADDVGKWPSEEEIAADGSGQVRDKQIWYMADAVKRQLTPTPKEEPEKQVAAEVPVIKTGIDMEHIREENAKLLDESWKGVPGEWTGVVW